MTKKKQSSLPALHVEILDNLTLEELARAVNAEPQLIIELIEYHVIIPEGDSQNQWRFNALTLKKTRIAVNFYRDLEMNLPGIAIALDLLERIHTLEIQLSTLSEFEKLFRK